MSVAEIFDALDKLIPLTTVSFFIISMFINADKGNICKTISFGICLLCYTIMVAIK